MKQAYIWNLMTLLTLLVSVPYAVVSFRVAGGDPLFTVCLIINTLLMRNAVRVVNKQIKDGEDFVTEDDVFNWWQMLIFGILYGGAFASMPFLMPYNAPGTLLKSLLALFLAVHNTLTGMCLVMLLRIYWHVWKRKDAIDIGLWDQGSPELDFYMRMIFSLVIHIAFIGCFAIGSCLLSYFTIGTEFGVFSIFTSLWLVFAYLFPHFPPRRRFLRMKQSKIAEINSLIEREVEAQMSQLVADTGPRDVEKLMDLQRIRDMVHQTRYRSGLQLKNIKTIVSLMIVPSLPTIVDYLISRFS